jgi:hypothetical protein
LFLEQLYSRGFAVVERYWSAEKCAAAVAEIEHALASDTPCRRWVDERASDHRLYWAERAGGELARFSRDTFIRRVRQYYAGVSGGESLLLAARLRHVRDNAGSGGGWHRDSPHTSQFKALMYLSDVTLETGPFEYLDGSHRMWSSLRLTIEGGTRPNQYRFTDDEVQRLLVAGARCTTFTGAAGTMLLVDSKGMHRGRPIEKGLRYAATHYYWDRAMPRDFLR